MDNDQSERPLAGTSEAYWPNHQVQSHHRRFPDFRRTLGGAGAADPPACEHPSVRRRSAPSSDRTCANGIFYVLRTGCQWKALDAIGICSGSTAHLRFQQWVAAGVLQELRRVGLERYDELKGLDWSWLSMDGAITKSPLAGGKPAPSPERPQGMCLDKGYDFAEALRTLEEFGFTAHIRSRGEEAHVIRWEAGFKARRWVVESTHIWLNRFRRILVRWDKSPENYIAILHFACALIRLRAAGLLGLALSTFSTRMVPGNRPCSLRRCKTSWTSCSACKSTLDLKAGCATCVPAIFPASLHQGKGMSLIVRS